MANGFDASHKRGVAAAGGNHDAKLGSRRIFAPQFKLQVLHSYRNDSDCRGNQRATARKYGIHRRQIQKWLQAEPALRGALNRRTTTTTTTTTTTPVVKIERPSTPPGPVDLSMRRAPQPAIPVAPIAPIAPVIPAPSVPETRPASPITPWDLTYKPPSYYPKYGYEFEAPAPPPPPAPAPQKSFRLFRPYLPEDNFGDFEAAPAPPAPPVSLRVGPASAFERVLRPSYCVDFRLQPVMRSHHAGDPRHRRWDYLEAVASAS